MRIEISGPELNPAETDVSSRAKTNGGGEKMMTFEVEALEHIPAEFDDEGFRLLLVTCPMTCNRTCGVLGWTDS